MLSPRNESIPQSVPRFTVGPSGVCVRLFIVAILVLKATVKSTINSHMVIAHVISADAQTNQQIDAEKVKQSQDQPNACKARARLIKSYNSEYEVHFLLEER